jgi:hypothetical protein
VLRGRVGWWEAGSKTFPQAVDVIVQYLADLVEAKVSSIREAYAQTGIPLTGQTVSEAMEALHVSLETVISARLGSWQGAFGYAPDANKPGGSRWCGSTGGNG